MTKICFTPEDFEAHKEVVGEFFNHRDYEVVQHWNDGFAGYWVVIKSDIVLKETLYCVRTFEIGGQIQFSVDTDRKL